MLGTRQNLWAFIDFIASFEQASRINEIAQVGSEGSHCSSTLPVQSTTTITRAYHSTIEPALPSSYHSFFASFSHDIDSRSSEGVDGSKRCERRSASVLHTSFHLVHRGDDTAPVLCYGSRDEWAADRFNYCQE